MSPAITSWAPTHSTSTTLEKTRKIAIAVSTARARMESQAAWKARSTGAAKRVGGARGGEGALDGSGEAAGGEPFIGESLQRAYCADQFGRIGGSVGERVLCGARATPHGAAKAVERQHDHRNGGEHKGG